MAKRCTQSPVGVHKIESDTSMKTYTVIIREDGKHTCDCTGFVTKRNKLGGYSALGDPNTFCKHVKRVLQTHGCGWSSEQPDAAVQKYPDICPLCHAPTEIYDPPPPATIDDELLNDTLAGLLSIREKMNQ